MDVSLEYDIGGLTQDYLPDLNGVYHESSLRNGVISEPAFVALPGSDYEGGSRHCSFEIVSEDGRHGQQPGSALGDTNGGSDDHAASGLDGGPLWLPVPNSSRSSDVRDCLPPLGNTFLNVEEDEFLERVERVPHCHTFSEFGLHDRRMGSFQSDAVGVGGAGVSRAAPNPHSSFESDSGGFVPLRTFQEDDQSFSLDRAQLDNLTDTREQVEVDHERSPEDVQSADAMTRSREVLERWRQDNAKKKKSSSRRPLASHTEELSARVEEANLEQNAEPSQRSSRDEAALPERSCIDQGTSTLPERPSRNVDVCRLPFDNTPLVETGDSPFHNVYSTFERTTETNEPCFRNIYSTFDKEVDDEAPFHHVASSLDRSMLEAVEPCFRNTYSTFDEIDPPNTLLTQDPRDVYQNVLPVGEPVLPKTVRQQPVPKALNGLTLSSFERGKPPLKSLSSFAQDDPTLQSVELDFDHIEFSESRLLSTGSRVPNKLKNRAKRNGNDASRNMHEAAPDSQFFHSDFPCASEASLNSSTARLLGASAEEKLNRNQGHEALRRSLPSNSQSERSRGTLEPGRLRRGQVHSASASDSFAGLGIDMMTSSSQSHNDRFESGLTAPAKHGVRHQDLLHQDLLNAALLAMGSLPGNAHQLQQGRGGARSAQQSQRGRCFENHQMPSPPGFQSLEVPEQRRYQNEERVDWAALAQTAASLISEERVDWAALAQTAAFAASQKANAIIQDMSTTPSQTAARATAMLAEVGRTGTAPPGTWIEREADRSSMQRPPAQFNFTGAPRHVERPEVRQPGLQPQVSKLSLADQLMAIGTHGSPPSRSYIASLLASQNGTAAQASMHIPANSSGIGCMGSNGQGVNNRSPLTQQQQQQQPAQQSQARLRVEWGEANTVMVRNIPPRYTQDMLLKEWPNVGNYDFLYLPICIDKKRNATYAFVNFNEPELAEQFYSTWHKKRLQHFSTKKALDISPADVQGRDDNLLHIVRNKTFRIKNIHFQPAIFHGSERISLDEFLTDLDMRMKANGGNPSEAARASSERQKPGGQFA